jgi:hypothetical protein
MYSGKSPDIDIIKDFERIVCRAKWRICEERAAEQLADTSGLRWTRLFRESPLIQVVAIDGMMIGCVWHNGRQWTATETGQQSPVVECDTFRAALLALACEAEPW